MFQNKIFITIIVGFVLHQGEAFLIRSSFDKLNDYLVDKCATDNLDENLRTVEQLVGDSSTSSASSSLTKATTLYIDLARAAGKCDRASLEILKDAVEETRGKAHIENPARRIDKLVQKYVFQHAKGCNEALQIDYDQKMRESDGELIGRVQNVSYSIRTAVRPIGDSSRGLFSDRDDLKDLMRQHLKAIGIRLKGAIRSSASNDPNVTSLKLQNGERNGKSSVDSVKLRKLYEDYVIQPCKYFLDKVDGIFEVAEFDYKVYKEPYLEQPYLREPGDTSLYIEDFMMGWLATSICTDVLSTLANPIFKELEKAVNDQ